MSEDVGPIFDDPAWPTGGHVAMWRVYRRPGNVLTTEWAFPTMGEAKAAAEKDAGMPQEWDSSANDGGKVTVFSRAVPYKDGTLHYVAEARD